MVETNGIGQRKRSACMGRGPAVAALMMAAGVSTVAIAMPVQAQEAARSFAIPAQPLATALTSFGQQSGLQVSVQAPLLAGHTSSAVSGTMSPMQALSQLLTGTGLTFRLVGATVTLAPAPQAADGAINLGPLRVEGSDSHDDSGASQVALGGNLRGPSSDPVARRLNPQTTVSSKVPVDQREVPQSLTVITQDQIQQQNLLTIDDAIRYTPGATVNYHGGGSTEYFSRGFPINTFQIDGIPTAKVGLQTGDLAMYDRVEVLRGPAGLLNGFGGDGGIINFVRKSAPDTFQLNTQLTGGTYDNLLEQVDVGGPLNSAGTIRARGVAMLHDQDLNQHGTWQHDRQFYGTVEADLTPQTLLKVGASHTSTTGKLMYNIPAYSDYTLPDIPVSTYLGADWNHNSNRVFDAFASVEQTLGAGWKVRLSYDHQRTTSSQIAGIAGGPIDPTTDDADLYSFSYAERNTQDSIDLNASGPFTLFGRTHYLTVGANYTNQKDDYYRYFVNTSLGYDSLGDVEANLFDNSAYISDFNGPRQFIYTTTRQYGFYGNARFSITDRLSLLTGGRMTWWKDVQNVPDDPDYNWWGYADTKDRIKGKITPFAGAIYDLSNHYSAYASYSSIFIPQVGVYTVDGTIIKPVTGNQYEAGVKGAWFNDRLNASVALFQIEERNRALADPNNPGFYLAEGRARSRGVEVTASGQILPGWAVSGGYTYTATKYLDASTNLDEPFSETTPKNLFKLWTHYQLPGALKKWSLGAGTYVSSSTSYSDGVGTITAHGYATFDGSLAYQISERTSVTVNATNMFNKKYYSTLTANGNTYGDPRKVLFTLRAAY